MKVASPIIEGLLAYGIPTWPALVLISFCAARFIGWLGVLAGAVVMALLLYVLDVSRIVPLMNAPDWDPAEGPDMDGPFMVFAFIKIMLANVALLPVTALALWLRHRSRKKSQAS